MAHLHRTLEWRGILNHNQEMSENRQTFFTQVGTRAERERVYTIVVERQLEVLAVTDEKDQVRLLPRYLTGATLVFAPKGAGDHCPQGQVTLAFDLGAEKYFMKAILKEGRGTDIHLDLTTDLFKLQRRNAFRLSIPTGFQAKILLTRRGTVAVKEDYDIGDLSGGGFAFDLTSANPKFQVGERVIGRLLVGNDLKTDFQGTVKHCRMIGSRGSGLCRVGVEFDDLTPAVHNEIINLVMGLHRNLFSKFA